MFKNHKTLFIQFLLHIYNSGNIRIQSLRLNTYYYHFSFFFAKLSTIHEFSVWLRKGCNPADLQRIWSKTKNRNSTFS